MAKSKTGGVDAVEKIAAQADAAEETGKYYTDAQVQELIRKAAADAVAEALKKAQTQASVPQVVQLASETEKVHFLWQAEVAEDNTVHFG
mgnify:FL=1